MALGGIFRPQPEKKKLLKKKVKTKIKKKIKN